ncbi:MAG: hypothetical protein VKJ64_14400 [Leptolyngbyaceae bacterium]|nr:hypothetical protein [Leptolyngbyaceae bacterium]
MRAELEQDWPNWVDTTDQIPSPYTPADNCLAGAAGERDRWWSPLPADDYYWPEGVPREGSVVAFIKADETLGFAVCETGALGSNVEKLAIYATPDGRPQHVARPLPNGRWTSKLGRLADIEQALDSLNGQLHGTVHSFMARY